MSVSVSADADILFTAKSMPHISNIKYIYTDEKYKIECIDFISQLQIEKTDYNSVLSAVQQHQQSAQNIKVLSYNIDKY